MGDGNSRVDPRRWDKTWGTAGLAYVIKQKKNRQQTNKIHTFTLIDNRIHVLF